MYKSVMLLLLLVAPVFGDETLEVKVSQVQYLRAASAEIVSSSPGVLILAEDLSPNKEYGVRVEVLNQAHRYIAVYRVVDPDLGLVAFPPEYVQPAPDRENIYFVTGAPNTPYWIEIRSETGPPVIEKIIIAPGATNPDPEDPEDPVAPPSSFEQLTIEVRKLVTVLNEPDVQLALYNVYNTFSPEESVVASNNKLWTAQSEALRVLGSNRQLDKDWYNGFVLPLDALLVSLQDKIKTGKDFGEVVKAIALALKPSTQSSIAEGNITMYTSPTCALCQDWKNQVLPPLLAVGWKFTEVQSTGPLPRFEVCTNGKCQRHEGFMSIQKFTEVVTSMRR